jgi:sortase A
MRAASSPTPQRDAGAHATRTARRVEPRPLHVRPVPIGAPIGTLQIPRLHETVTFRQGVGADVLQYGPGHYPMTKLPGQLGTVAIAGHRTTHTHPFLHLNALRRNDAVVVAVNKRRFTYRVYAMRIVRPTDVWVLMLRSRAARLVLTACHPPHRANYRIVVFARLAGPALGTPVAGKGRSRP